MQHDHTSGNFMQHNHTSGNFMQHDHTSGNFMQPACAIKFPSPDGDQGFLNKNLRAPWWLAYCPRKAQRG